MSKVTVALTTFVAMTASVLIATVSASGCTTHQCEATSTTLGMDGGIDVGIGSWRLDCSLGCSLTWRLAPFIGDGGDGGPGFGWIDLPASKTYTFLFPPLPSLPEGYYLDFDDLIPLGYVAIAPPGADDGAAANATQIAGVNLQFTAFAAPGSLSDGGGNGWVTVTNPTCSGDTFLNVVLEVPLGQNGGDGGVGDDQGDGGDEGDGGDGNVDP